MPDNFPSVHFVAVSVDTCQSQQILEGWGLCQALETIHETGVVSWRVHSCQLISLKKKFLQVKTIYSICKKISKKRHNYLIEI